ncbi:MAG: transporter substrate-binding domain-containing protein [Mycobacterium sp.]|nr:transporter substrate-binding domain-containing protein [Mycobacterium sp.]
MVFLLVLSLLAGNPSAAAESSLRICTTGDYPPLTQRDPVTGGYTGIDIEMSRALADHLGRTPVYLATTWPTLSQDLETCDIAVGGITITSARMKVGEFTIPYLDTGKAPLARRAVAPQLQSLEQINQPGVRVIENPGGTNEQFARAQLPNADLIIWPDNVTIFDRLAGGAADVMITDNIEARYQAALNPELVAVNPEHPFTSDQKAYLLPHGSTLTADVDAWLHGALTNGTFDQILQRWIGPGR